MEQLSDLEQRIKNPYPMAGFERKLFLTISLLLIAGVLVSITFEDWQYFERFGSLIVVVGIFITWKDFTGTLYGLERHLETYFTEELRKLRNVKPRGLITGKMHEGKLEQSEIALELTKKVTKLLRKRIQFTEASILIFGTVIWGWGAPFFGLIHQFPDA